MELFKIVLQGLLFIGTSFSIISFMGSIGPDDESKRNSSILMMIACVLLIVFIQRYWM